MIADRAKWIRTTVVTAVPSKDYQIGQPIKVDMYQNLSKESGGSFIACASDIGDWIQVDGPTEEAAIEKLMECMLSQRAAYDEAGPMQPAGVLGKEIATKFRAHFAPKN